MAFRLAHHYGLRVIARPFVLDVLCACSQHLVIDTVTAVDAKLRGPQCDRWDAID